MTDLFPQRLRSCRERRRISQRTTAELCGLSKSMICRCEKGQVIPTIEVAAQLADLFEVSLDWLCGRS